MFLKDTFPGDSNREAVSDEEASGKLSKAPGGWQGGASTGAFF